MNIMEKQKISRPINSIFLVVFAGMMLIPITLSAQKFTFVNSSVVPAAEGYAKVKKDKNKNYKIKVEVTDLAEVGRVQSTKTTYVVWMETDQGNAENLGQLKSSTAFLSKRLTASLETTTPYKPVKIFITTESGLNVQFPGEQIVLTTEMFSKR